MYSGIRSAYNAGAASERRMNRMTISSARHVRQRRGQTYTGSRGRRTFRSFRRRGITPAQRGYVRTSGFYGRFTTGGERKFHDVVIDDAVVATTMTINNLTIIAEGNGESERVGRKVTLTRISIMYSLQLPAAAAATSSSDTVRVFLVQDKQTNGAQFAATDLIDLDNMNSFNNLANSNRFRVLFKKEFSFSAGGAAPSGAALIFSEDRNYLRFSLKINIPIEYDNSATTGVITSVRSNNIYWCTQSESGLVSCVGRARLRYTDQ